MVANDGVKTNSPRKFGADIVGDIAWGTHLCQFYQTKQDMIDILVPYFVEGLRNNEFCMWITSLPLEVAEAKEELRKAAPDLDNCIQRGQIDIRPYTDWYLIDGQFNADKVLEEWLRKEKEALSRGFEGLRLTGNTLWIEKADWKNFVEYEAKINNVIGSHKMIALCTYSLEKCTGEDVVDVIKNHVGTLIRKGEAWNLVEDVTQRKTIELELWDSEKKYRSLFKNMVNGLAYYKVLFGSDGKPVDYVFLEVNDAFERLTGLRREEVVGRKVTDVSHGGGKGVEDLIGIYGKVAMTGEISQFDLYFSLLEKWYQIMAYCPEREFFIVSFQDITDRKRAEEEAFRLASFPKLNPNPVVEIDLDGNLCYFNPAAEMMVPGLKESSLDHPFFRDWQHVIQTFEKEKKNSFSREVRIGDRWFYQLIHFVPETNRVRIYSTNIDSLKQVENEHRETLDYLENLLNYANAPIIVWDSEFKITRFNHAFERLTGLSSKDAIGKPLEILFPATQKEEAMNHILDTLKGEHWEAVEIPIMRTDGTVRTALWNSANVCDANSKKVSATIAQGQDITERKKLEEKLKIAERMAGIGEMAAMVGHDIRNPLQAILGYCSVAEELLKVETNDESQRKKLLQIFEQVKDQVRYTDKIVSDLRDYSSPVTLIPVRTDLCQLIKDSLSLSGIPETISVSIDIPKNLLSARVDPSILRRVLVNLIANAVQAMPKGGRLKLKVARRKNPATLVLSVEDTGIGIPKEDRSKIFVPLFTTKAKGQGLGLPVCKRLIEAQDGTITFKSKADKGSKFIIKIPLR